MVVASECWHSDPADPYDMNMTTHDVKYIASMLSKSYEKAKKKSPQYEGMRKEFSQGINDYRLKPCFLNFLFLIFIIALIARFLLRQFGFCDISLSSLRKIYTG